MPLRFVAGSTDQTQNPAPVTRSGMCLCFFQLPEQLATVQLRLQHWGLRAGFGHIQLPGLAVGGCREGGWQCANGSQQNLSVSQECNA